MVRLSLSIALAAVLGAARPATAQDVVRLGNLKFAHYGAVSYMKQACGKFGLEVQEIVFPKGIDIFPAIVKGEVDLAASAADAAIANRAGGGQVYVVAGFAKGGARLVAATKQSITFCATCGFSLYSFSDITSTRTGSPSGVSYGFRTSWPNPLLIAWEDWGSDWHIASTCFCMSAWFRSANGR